MRYFLFIALIFPKIGEVAASILGYAALLLFSSVILVFTAFMGLAVVQSNFLGLLLSYFVLDFILIITSFVLIISPILYKWLFPTYKTIRMVI